VHAVGAVRAVTAVVEAVDGFLVDAMHLFRWNLAQGLHTGDETCTALALFAPRAVGTVLPIRARNAPFTVQTLDCFHAHAVLGKRRQQTLTVRKFTTTCAFSAVSQASKSFRFYALLMVFYCLQTRNVVSTRSAVATLVTPFLFVVFRTVTAVGARVVTVKRKRV